MTKRTATTANLEDSSWTYLSPAKYHEIEETCRCHSGRNMTTARKKWSEIPPKEQELLNEAKDAGGCAYRRPFARYFVKGEPQENCCLICNESLMNHEIVTHNEKLDHACHLKCLILWFSFLQMGRCLTSSKNQFIDPEVKQPSLFCVHPLCSENTFQLSDFAYKFLVSPKRHHFIHLYLNKEPVQKGQVYVLSNPCFKKDYYYISSTDPSKKTVQECALELYENDENVPEEFEIKHVWDTCNISHFISKMHDILHQYRTGEHSFFFNIDFVVIKSVGDDLSRMLEPKPVPPYSPICEKDQIVPCSFTYSPLDPNGELTITLNPSQPECVFIQQLIKPEFFANKINYALGTFILLQKGKTYLIVRRATTAQTLKNCLVAPGGYVEIGEQLFTAARRELKEETGVECPEITETPLVDPFDQTKFEIVQKAFVQSVIPRNTSNNILFIFHVKVKEGSEFHEELIPYLTEERKKETAEANYWTKDELLKELHSPENPQTTFPPGMKKTLLYFLRPFRNYSVYSLLNSPTSIQRKWVVSSEELFQQFLQYIHSLPSCFVLRNVASGSLQDRLVHVSKDSSLSDLQGEFQQGLFLLNNYSDPDPNCDLFFNFVTLAKKEESIPIDKSTTFGQIIYHVATVSNLCPKYLNFRVEKCKKHTNTYHTIDFLDWLNFDLHTPFYSLFLKELNKKDQELQMKNYRFVLC